MKAQRKKMIIVLMILVVAGVSGYFWKTLLGQRTTEDGLFLYGHIDIRDAQLAFKEQERISEVMVEEGSTVTKGQILARLESERLMFGLNEARAQYAAQKQVLRRLTNGTRKQEIKQAQARVSEAVVNMRNIKRLVQRLEQTSTAGASSAQDLDDAHANLDMARARLNVRQEALALAREGYREEEIAEAEMVLKARQARLALFQQRLKDTVLRAPAKGVILSRILEPGETATPARPAFVLALTDPKWVRAYLPEPDLGKIRQGMKARIYSDSFKNHFFEGRVGFISAQAEYTPKTVQTTRLRTNLVYEVRIWTDDPHDRLRLGMPVTVKIVNAEQAPENDSEKPHVSAPEGRLRNGNT